MSNNEVRTILNGDFYHDFINILPKAAIIFYLKLRYLEY